MKRTFFVSVGDLMLNSAVTNESVKALCQNLEDVYVDKICMSASVLDSPELDLLDDVQNPTD